jgi:hypothetical protein
VLEFIIFILFALWLIGYVGPKRFPRIPNSGSLIHLLLIVAVNLIVVRLLQ